MKTTNPRKLRGVQLLAHNKVEMINDSTFRVSSQSGQGSYVVVRKGLNWVCECADFEFNRVVCKHIYAVEQYWQGLRRTIPHDAERLEELCEPEQVCKYCGSSNLIKRGIRKNKSANAQRFSCKDCGKRFVVNVGFEKMKATPQVVTIALDLYFKGISLRKIVDHLDQFYGVKVVHVAVFKWIKKYVQIMKDYVDQLVPQVSGIWHSDEMTLNTRVHGEFQWLWNVMDNETRFWLASQITEQREIEDARTVLAEAKNIARVRPLAVVTDGLRAYQSAIPKEFRTMKMPRTEHIRIPNIRDRSNNNLVERLHGTIRERNKVMRGLEDDETAQTIIDGLRIYYNFIRPHQALNGKTPAQRAKLNLKLERNRWISLIKASST
jgi:transposase-like protein